MTFHPLRLLIDSNDDVGSGEGSGETLTQSIDGWLLWYYAFANYLYHQIFEPIGDALPDLGDYILSAEGCWVLVLVGLICCCMPYMLFQKHLLTHNCGKVVGRCYFWPCVPCSIYGNKVEFKGQWCAVCDEQEPNVLLGQAPLFSSQLQVLDDMGCKAVINLCDEYKGPSRYYRRNGISLLWLKTVDHLEPTVEAMHTACSFIEHHRRNGSPVYIHCKSGRGRSAAIAMAWLMHHRKMTPMQAQQHLLDRRKVRSKLWRQRNVIQFYEEISDTTIDREGSVEFESNRGGDVELGQMGGGDMGEASGFAFSRPTRTISFATVAPPRPDRGRSARNSLAAKRDILRAPLTGGDDDYSVDDRPPNWAAQGMGGVWEINVRPLDTTFAQPEGNSVGQASKATAWRAPPLSSPFASIGRMQKLRLPAGGRGDEQKQRASDAGLVSNSV